MIGHLKWNYDDQYLISKHASEHYGKASTLRKFNSQFPYLKEGKTRSFKYRVEEELTEMRTENKTIESILKYCSSNVCTLMVEEIDRHLVQNYIKGLRNRIRATAI